MPAVLGFPGGEHHHVPRPGVDLLVAARTGVTLDGLERVNPVDLDRLATISRHRAIVPDAPSQAAVNVPVRLGGLR